MRARKSEPKRPRGEIMAEVEATIYTALLRLTKDERTIVLARVHDRLRANDEIAATLREKK